MMTSKSVGAMSLGFLKVMEVAKRDPKASLYSLAHLIDEETLKRSYSRIRKNVAVGGDGVTKDEYGENLDERIRDLHGRLRQGKYRHQPIRRVHIPKEKGKTRPIGVSTIEDKVVQGAIAEILQLAYEPVFADWSYGFRPARSAHDALRALNRELHSGGINWILEADIQSYFDSINRKVLTEQLRERINDKSLLRLISKCLHVGILEGEEYSKPEGGAVQGSILSPLMGNVYLHYVLDEWFQQEVLPRMKGRAFLIRYADDFVMGFSREDDALKVQAALAQRFERYDLKLHPEKTRLMPFARPSYGSKGKGPGTFDFLGFTVHWRRGRRGGWNPGMKTRKAKLRGTITSLSRWCRDHRHLPVKQQHAALRVRLQGHYNYFGVNGNTHSMKQVRRTVEKAWRKWLSRRSQKAAIPWPRFEAMLEHYPLPAPRVVVRLWSS